MKRMSSFALAVLCLVTCQPFASHRACSSEAAVNDNLLLETRRELDQVRAATATFHDLSAAVLERYIDIDVFVSGQGFHFLKNSFLLDGQFEIDKPEILVYAPLNGRLQLVCVEYAVPISASSTPPEGFTGDSDVWEFNDAFQIWTLHCWVWKNNPNGIFADVNPLVP
jgi:hypothetical protein